MKIIIDSNKDYEASYCRLLKYTNRAIATFEKNCLFDSNYSYLIKKLHEVPLNLIINPRFTLTYGLAYYLGTPTNIKELTIEINKLYAKYRSRISYQIITHELAHCIDYFIRGDSFHDKEWSAIHQKMGGTGTTFIY